ncbi:MAG: outer membrane beta-barrel protein [Treponema sp.]|nr:outer membrane beta-barrel protein [Treponema sp.]
MKKIIATIATLFAATSLFAAELPSVIKDRNLTVGGRIGLGLNFFDFKCGGDVGEDIKLMPGFGLNAFANMPISTLATLPEVLEPLGVQVELGLHVHNISSSDKDDETSKAHYFTLDIPILATYKLDVNDMISVQPLLGPKFSFTLGKVYNDGYFLDGFGLKSPFNFGIEVGATAFLNLVGPGQIVVDIRYNRDFTKMTGDGDFNLKHDGTSYKLEDPVLGSGQSIDISVGYQMKLNDLF